MGFQMRNGPQTWPINGHGSIDWMQQCDGEMSPRQYTALIRRASSLHYRPKHFLNHHSGGLDLTDKTGGREISKTEHTYAFRDKNSVLGVRNLERSSFRDNYSRVLNGSVSYLPTHPDRTSKFPHGRNCRLSQSFRLPSSSGLIKQFNNLNLNSPNRHQPKGETEDKPYVKLSSSTHLSESNDFQTQEKPDHKYSSKNILNKEVKLRKCKAVINLQLTRDRDTFSPENLVTASISDPQTTQLDRRIHTKTAHKTLVPLLSSTSSSVISRSLSHLPSSPTGLSPTLQPSSPTQLNFIPSKLPSPTSSLSSPKPSLSPLLPVMSSTPHLPISSPPIVSSPQPLSLSPSDIKVQPKHVYERPYYDCGYDTDYDSTPPHSSPECDDGKLKAIDSSPVWSRYLAWLHRMTKTQS